ncbi:hypothetical protein IQ250_25980 [Pseudanabaenaceae cyanobacterium LEGE 13415]|nr:hypothetical protein [Pseudanabaenaceae cyanobacterium LEGE 13415]
MQSQVFPAKLVGAALKVQDSKIQTLMQDQSLRFVSALVDLATIYAKALKRIAPEVAAEQPMSCLRTIWLARSESALLAGAEAFQQAFADVPNPQRAVNLMRQLLEAAGQIEAWKDQLRDPKFVDGLINLAIEYANLNPRYVTLYVEESQQPFNAFLNTLWDERVDIRQGARELYQFFEPFTTPEQRLQVLKFSRDLLEVARKADALREVRSNAKVLNHLLDLGREYAAIDPSEPAEKPQLFLDTLWRNSNVAEGTAQLEQYLSIVEGPATLLSFDRKVLSALRKVLNIQEDLRDVAFITQILNWSGLYAAAKQNTISNVNVIDPGAFFRYLWDVTSSQAIADAADAFNEFISDLPTQTVDSIWDLDLETADSSLATTESVLAYFSKDKSINTSLLLYARFPPSRKVPRIPVLIPRGRPPVAPALKLLLRAIGAVGGAILSVLIDDAPLAVTEIFSSGRNLQQRGREDRRRCKAGNIYPRAGGSAYGNAYATHVTGTIFDYGVWDHFNNYCQYDGLVVGTLNFVAEAKRGYRGAIYANNGAKRESQLRRWDEQRQEGQVVADHCGLVHAWFFNNKDIAEIVEQRWINTQTLVYYEYFPNEPRSEAEPND